MKKVFRFFGWALLVLVAVGLVAAGAAQLLAQRKLNRSIEVNVAPSRSPATTHRSRAASTCSSRAAAASATATTAPASC